MGNVCCDNGEKVDANGKREGEIDGNTMMKIKNFRAGNEATQDLVMPSPLNNQKFGTDGHPIDKEFFKLKPVVSGLIEKHGLFTWKTDSQEIINFAENRTFRVSKPDFTFEGQMNGQKKNGKGYLLKKSGDLWVCPFIDDSPSGTGAIYYETGDYFEGKIYKGNTIEGKMVYADGSFYVGQFMTDGYRDGKGTFYDLTGGRYEGNWKNNLKDGQGIYCQNEVWRNGVRVENPGKEAFKNSPALNGPGDYQNTPMSSSHANYQQAA